MMLPRKSQSLCHAFTLIELLIVVAIIAILAAIAVPNFLEAQTRAKVSRAKADMRAMATAAERYHIDFNKYMTDSNAAPGYQQPKYMHDSWGTSNSNDYKKILIKYPGLKYDALFKLTSPVSYMSSLPANNPFGTYEAYNPGDYWDGYTFRGTSVMERIAATVYPPEWVGKTIKFAFDSTGPSKKLRYQNRILVYDPTNGTMSHGGIWYINGSPSLHSFH